MSRIMWQIDQLLELDLKCSFVVDDKKYADDMRHFSTDVTNV